MKKKILCQECKANDKHADESYCWKCRYNPRLRLMRKSRRNGDCIEWTGHVDRKGYGRTLLNKKPWGTHRLAYTLNVGPIPKGKMICHSCDNPPCINPKHLWAGTSRENVLDSISKGRWRK